MCLGPSSGFFKDHIKRLELESLGINLLWRPRRDLGHETEGPHLDPDCCHWFPHVYDWNMEFPVRSRVGLLGTAQQNIGICPMTLEPKVHDLGHRDPSPQQFYTSSTSPEVLILPLLYSLCVGGSGRSCVGSVSWMDFHVTQSRR